MKKMRPKTSKPQPTVAKATPPRKAGDILKRRTSPVTAYDKTFSISPKIKVNRLYDIGCLESNPSIRHVVFLSVEPVDREYVLLKHDSPLACNGYCRQFVLRNQGSSVCGCLFEVHSQKARVDINKMVVSDSVQTGENRNEDYAPHFSAVAAVNIYKSDDGSLLVIPTEIWSQFLVSCKES